MGMYDSLYDAHGHSWQTKGLGRSLNWYRIGDALTIEGDRELSEPVEDYQFEILGGVGNLDSYATVRKGKLAEVDVPRDVSLPLFDYWGDPR